MLELCVINDTLLNKLNFNYVTYSETETVLDNQVLFVPSVEVLVKALLVISPVILDANPRALLQIVFCSHHPCLCGTSKRNAVWKVVLLRVTLCTINFIADIPNSSDFLLDEFLCVFSCNYKVLFKIFS